MLRKPVLALALFFTLTAVSVALATIPRDERPVALFFGQASWYATHAAVLAGYRPEYVVLPGKAELTNWRKMTDANAPWLQSFVADMRPRIAQLDPRTTIAIGTSRGAYLALYVAARTPLQNVIALSPMTEPNALDEFHGAVRLPPSLRADAPALHSKNLLLIIGDHDERVGTQNAVALAQAIGSEIIVSPADGHSEPAVTNDVIARWLRTQQAHLASVAP